MDTQALKRPMQLPFKMGMQRLPRKRMGCRKAPLVRPRMQWGICRQRIWRELERDTVVLLTSRRSVQQLNQRRTL